MTDIHALSGAYALNAVTDIERAQFVRHLAECPACALEVGELTETAARLAEGTEAAPPAGLRDRVLAEVTRTRQVGPERVRPVAAGRWRRPLAIAVAAAAVLVVLGVGAGVQEQRVRDARQQAATASRVEAVLNAPDATLRSAPGPGGTGRVSLVVSQSMNEAVAVLGDLPDPGSGRTYELWMLSGAQTTAKGLLGTDATGGTVLITGVRGQEAFAVTNEPAGGSAVPTLPTFAKITLG